MGEIPSLPVFNWMVQGFLDTQDTRDGDSIRTGQIIEYLTKAAKEVASWSTTQ